MTWREHYNRVHGRRYRWRVAGWRDDGTPHGLEIERYISAAGEWAPVPNHNVRDAFAMGLVEGMKMGEQTRLSI